MMLRRRWLIGITAVLLPVALVVAVYFANGRRWIRREAVATPPKPEAPPDLEKLRPTFTSGLDALQRGDGRGASKYFSSFNFGVRNVEQYRLYFLANGFQVAGDKKSARLTLAELWDRAPHLVYWEDVGFNLGTLYAGVADWNHASDVYERLANRSESPPIAANARWQNLNTRFAAGDAQAVLNTARDLIVKNPRAPQAADAIAILRSLTARTETEALELTPAQRLERAVNLINGLDTRPDLILFTGDLTHDSEDPAEHARRMKSFRAIADRLHVKKRYHVPGEHDAALDGGTLFRENFGETHYSFDHRGVHFVALDNVSLGKPIVGAAQTAWLKNDLARYPKTAPIIVFTHRPLFDLRPDWEWFTRDGDDVLNALAPFENVTILYGHIHRHDVHQSEHAMHYASRSLIFAFPDPTVTADKKPLPFDAVQPFRNLGIRKVRSAPLLVEDFDLTPEDHSGLTASVEMSRREIAGSNGIQQLVKGAVL